MNSSTTRSTWGATKAGRRGPALWAPAVAIGVLTAGVVGGLTYVFSPSQTPALLALVTAVTTLPVAVALGWAILVAPSSITGAVERPEESVESRWLERASVAALMDGFAMIGLSAGAIVITEVEVAADVVLMALWVLLSVDLGVRYLVLRRTA